MVLGFSALLIAMAALVLIWRLRGVFQWKSSIKHELMGLKEDIESAGPCRKRALNIVLERCQKIWGAGFPEVKEIYGLGEYVKKIAASFHPDQDRPELCITAGRIIMTSNSAILRLQEIMGRPGFSRFQRIRIRHIRKSWDWYEKISNYKSVKIFIRYKKWISRTNLMRLIFLPDPFSWLIYFSNQLTIISITRFFLMDIYLFVGKQAITAYDHGSRNDLSPEDPYRIEEELSELAEIIESEPSLPDPEIQEIRSRLVGMNAMLFSTPGYSEWKDGLFQAIEIIARKNFPESQEPIEEARLGPILQRCQFWLKSVSGTEKIPVISRLQKIEIRHLHSIKAVTEHPVFRHAGIFARKSWDIYKLTKWPRLLYRIIKKTTPAGIAATMGWMLARKGAVNYLSRKTFDVTIQEMEMIYRLSSDKKSEKRLIPDKPAISDKPIITSLFLS